MPSKEEHLAKATRNESFADSLARNTKYFDWAVTVLYYAAVHYVDAVLAVSSAHPEKHTERHALIATNGTLKRVYKEYRQLESVSRNARYRALPVGASDWTKAIQAFDVLRGYIRTHLGLKD